MLSSFFIRRRLSADAIPARRIVPVTSYPRFSSLD